MFSKTTYEIDSATSLRDLMVLRHSQICPDLTSAKFREATKQDVELVRHRVVYVRTETPYWRGAVLCYPILSMQS